MSSIILTDSSPGVADTPADTPTLDLEVEEQYTVSDLTLFSHDDNKDSKNDPHLLVTRKINEIMWYGCSLWKMGMPQPMFKPSVLPMLIGRRMDVKAVDVLGFLHDKQLFKSKHKWHLFIAYTQLVAMGVRDAYLVDGISLDVVQATAVVDRLSVALGFPGTLRCIALGDDVIIIRKYCLLHRLQLELSSSWWPRYRPVTVDIDTGAPRVCEDLDRMEMVRTCLLDAFAGLDHDATTPFIVPTSPEFNAHVGFPFLAGWLLGYPFVYRSTPGSSSGGGGGDSVGGPSAALSMVSLHKVSVRVALDSYWEALAARGSVSSAPTIDVWEFTVPSAVLGAADASKNAESTYQALLDRWVEAQRFRLATLIADRVDVSFEDVELPSLVI